MVLSWYFILPHVSNIGPATRGPVVPGLRNWANWCFCNSVLQGVSSLPSFRKWLDQNITETATQLSNDRPEVEDPEDALADMQNDSSTPLSMTMRGMIRVLNIEGPSKVLSSSPLVQALEAVQKNHISRNQQDAQEFLHMLLESIAAEQNNLPASVSIQQMSKLAMKAGREYKRLPFEGALQTSSTCTACKHELKSQTMPFLELTLLPPSQSHISISECLETTLQSEFIEDYNCIHCQIALLKRSGQDTSQHEIALSQNPDFDLPNHLPKSHVTLKRQASLVSLPQILILHVNRSVFGSYATRNAINVTFNDLLPLNHDMYALRSVVTHSGSHDRGHYIAYRKRGKKWYAISDETVRIVDLETVLRLGSATFLMFYEMIDPVSRQAEKKEKKRRKKRKGSKGKSQEEEEVGEGEELDEIESKI